MRSMLVKNSQGRVTLLTTQGKKCFHACARLQGSISAVCTTTRTQTTVCTAVCVLVGVEGKGVAGLGVTAKIIIIGVSVKMMMCLGVWVSSGRSLHRDFALHYDGRTARHSTPARCDPLDCGTQLCCSRLAVFLPLPPIQKGELISQGCTIPAVARKCASNNHVTYRTSSIPPRNIFLTLRDSCADF